MITVLRDIQPIARKKYKCDACELFLDGSLYKEDMDESDYETVLEAKKDRWEILPGTRYRKLSYVEDGVFYTFRRRLDMDCICDKYELFDEL